MLDIVVFFVCIFEVWWSVVTPTVHPQKTRAHLRGLRFSVPTIRLSLTRTKCTIRAFPPPRENLPVVFAHATTVFPPSPIGDPPSRRRRRTGDANPPHSPLRPSLAWCSCKVHPRKMSTRKWGWLFSYSSVWGTPRRRGWRPGVQFGGRGGYGARGGDGRGRPVLRGEHAVPALEVSIFKW